MLQRCEQLQQVTFFQVRVYQLTHVLRYQLVVGLDFRQIAAHI